MDTNQVIATTLTTAAILVLMGSLTAYGIVALILGGFLWPLKTVPDGFSAAIAASGIGAGIVVALVYLYLRFIGL